jgi:hypothetical protein
MAFVLAFAALFLPEGSLEVPSGWWPFRYVSLDLTKRPHPHLQRFGMTIGVLREDVDYGCAHLRQYARAGTQGVSVRTGVGSAPIREAIRPAPIQLGAQHGCPHAARPDRKKSGSQDAARRHGPYRRGRSSRRRERRRVISIFPRFTIQFSRASQFNFTTLVISISQHSEGKSNTFPFSFTQDLNPVAPLPRVRGARAQPPQRLAWLVRTHSAIMPCDAQSYTAVNPT